MSRVLVIDDENDICFLISEILNDESHICETANNSEIALIKFNKFNPDLVILDVWLGNSELDGLQLLLKFKELNPLVPIIIISGHGTVDMAVNAIKNGAYDFIEKPFNSEKITITSRRAIESASLLKENTKLKSMINHNIPLLGNSNFIIQLKKNLKKLANSNSRVFITGSQGVGKKLLSQILHQESIFSKSLCNIIDIKNTSKYELDIFFSNIDNKIEQNILVQSNNTTLILDNIDFLNIEYQKKLLFFLEKKVFFDNLNIFLKQKIIAINNNSIEDEISKGNFLQSLYDRLAVIKIDIPDINFRREDIIPIFEYYLNYYNKNKKYRFNLSNNVKSKLELYEWPGNVSQIINYAEKAIILNQDFNNTNHFEIENLPLDMGDYERINKKDNNYELSLKEARNNFEKDYLLSQIKRFNGNIKKISEFTGMERTALYRKFKSLNIETNKN